VKNTPKQFRLSPQGAMIAIVSAAFANPALANTGKVDFAVGNITVTGLDGRGRALVKGTEVKTGDKIVSSLDGRAQIRFSDGAYVSLQPNTEFDIQEYRYSGKTDGSESALFGLFKGAMRTVTGFVGRANKSRYKITTATATIGIRGTGGLISIGGDGSTLVTGSSGIWTLTNKGGTIDIPAGTAGFAGANVNVPPKPVDVGPVVPPAQSIPQRLVPPTTIVQGDVVSALGTPTSLFTLLTSGPGYAVGDAGAGGGPNSLTTFTPSNSVPAVAIFDPSGRLVEFTNSAIGAAPTVTTLAGTHNEFGTDGVLAWDRWTGNVAVTVGTTATVTTFGPNQGLHTVVGLPTPVASMPLSGQFTYSLLGATSPTFTSGATAPGTFSGTLVGDFTTHTVGLNMSVTMPTSTTTSLVYNAVTTGFQIGGPNVGSQLTIALGTSGFSGVIPTTAGLAGANCNSGSCTTNISGGFAGTGATHAGFVYQINDPGAGNVISGAAAFKR